MTGWETHNGNIGGAPSGRLSEYSLNLSKRSIFYNKNNN